MLKHFLIFSMLSILLGISAKQEMNKAFSHLVELLPFITGEEGFLEKKNEKIIEENINGILGSFKRLKHEPVLQNDLFAPSYEIIQNYLVEVKDSFPKQKRFTQWRLKELTSLCIDCHTRIPEDHPSYYQQGQLILNKNKFKNIYNLGISQLLTRLYPDAKWSFTQYIDDALITKDFRHVESAFKQLLLIKIKVQEDFEDMRSTIHTYQKKEILPEEIKETLSSWEKELRRMRKIPLTLKTQNEKGMTTFIQKNLEPLKNLNAPDLADREITLLSASGILSRFLFKNPDSKLSPQLSFWIGWLENRLKREKFYTSGEGFLKQCIRKYPTAPVAKECLDELKSIIEFEFTGSRGSDIPAELQAEMRELTKLIEEKRKK